MTKITAKGPVWGVLFFSIFSIALFTFQNCSPSFNAMDEATLEQASLSLAAKCTQIGNACRTDFGAGFCSETDPSVTGESLKCREEQCSMESSMFSISESLSTCVPNQNFISISHLGLTRISLNELKSYPLLITHSPEQALVPNKSSFKITRGTCPATTSWAPLNQIISPAKLKSSGPSLAFAPGYNSLNFTADIKSDLLGCSFDLCAETVGGLKSCLNADVPSQSTGTPICTSFNYSAYGACQPNGKQTRTVTGSMPAGCTGGTPILEQNCNYTPPTVTCTSFTYTPYGSCQPNNKQTRSITSSSPSGCTGGNPVLEQNCTYVPPAVTCTSFTYSPYGSCQTNNKQSRTVISSSPTGCTGGTPILEQDCVYTPPVVTCNSFNYSPYGSCQPNNKQTRTVISSFPTGCTGGNPILEQDCVYTPPVVTCNSFTYSPYGACQPNGMQTRTVISSSPTGCTGGAPILEQRCDYVAPTCTSFTYTEYSACSNNRQYRSVISSSPAGCTGGAPELDQYCNPSLTKLSTLQNVGGVVEVPTGVTAYIDRDIDVAQLRVNGKLVCGDETKSFKILTETLWVNGAFECGSEANPYDGNLTIQLKRNASIMPRTGYEINGGFATNPTEIMNQQIKLDENANLSLRFRAVLVTGQLKLFGVSKGRVSRLIRTLTAGQSSLVVDSATNWKVGDEIAVAPTGLTYQEDEKFKITGISGNLISLNRAATYTHYGLSSQVFTGQTKSFTLDQRAEVINLTRNIKIESHDHLADGTEMNQLNPEQYTSEPGGHVMIHGNGFAQISAVEFYKLGQAGVMARYPFHWHRVGDTTGQFIKNSSIHKSFQRCVTVHATNDTLVENNFCYDFRGHGYFLEDGNEIDNTLIYNVAMAGKVPHSNKFLLASDDPAKTTPFRFPGPSMYWISNPKNTVTDNIGVGMPGTVFWNTFEEGLGSLKTTYLATTAFDRNVAKSAFVGHNWDGAPANPKDWMNEETRNNFIQANHARNPNNHADRLLENAHYNPNPPAVFNDLVATNLSQAAVYFRGNTVTFNQALLADNHWGFFLAYNQRVTNSVIVGRSQSYTPNSLKAIGAVLYDGPFEFFNVDFYNFDAQSANTNTINDPSPIPFYSIGGSDKVTNLVRNLRFIPNVQYKALLEKHVADPWVDKFLSNSIRDMDGTLTGTAGQVIVPDTDVTAATNCVRQTPFFGFRVCPAGTRVGSMSVTSIKHGGFASVALPYLMRKINKTTGAYTESHTPQDIAMIGTNVGTFLNRKIHIAREDNEFAYEIHMRKNFNGLSKVGDLDLAWFSEGDNSASPLFKIVGYGSNCRLNGATQYNSLAELNAANGSGYYSHRSSFFVKINPSGIWSIATANGAYSTAKPWVGVLQVACDQDYVDESDYVNYINITNPIPPSGEIMGYIDGVGGDGTVLGWACLKASSKQIPIHVYANAPAGGDGAEFVGATIANSPSENAVAQACGDTSMTVHRFNFSPPPGFSGKKIYIHGINGFNNTTINNSGTHSFK